MIHASPLPLRDVVIEDDFWSPRIRIAREVSIDYMWRAINDEVPGVPPSGAIRNFRIAAGLEKGSFAGQRFQDSDLYKWLEAVAYSLQTHPDPSLMRRADEAIALISQAQQPDGYLDTYIQLNGLVPWTDTARAHEMYCAGHMIEAAVAYRRATGNDNLLMIARRFADHIDSVFGDASGKKRGYPGHQEIELALYKLFRETGEERYLKLSKFFLDTRGEQPYYYDLEQDARTIRGDAPIDYFRNQGVMPFSYQQAHLPVREQKEAVGHAVRVVYMAAGMADVGGECDPSLLDAARTLFDNIADTQMYITGGIGSMCDGEAFTFPYDLPNDRMYNETCASIGLMMFSQRMVNIEGDARYADVLERALYNNTLAGLSLDGTKFFYVNPMEMWPERSARRHDMMQDIVAERQGWYGCACCPPNVLRTLLSLGQYIYAQRGDAVFVHLYVGSQARFCVDGHDVTLIQKGNYPWDGHMSFRVSTDSPAAFSLYLRIPEWCQDAEVSLNGRPIELETEKGYAVITRTFSDGDRIDIILPMKPKFVYCDSRVPYNAGKTALVRGPIVYCTEQADNGDMLWTLAADPSHPVETLDSPAIGGGVALRIQGSRQSLQGQGLYTERTPEQSPATITMIPYYAWGNRGAGEMSVWQNVRPCP